MAGIYANIELINSWDWESAKKGRIDQDEVRHINVNIDRKSVV